MQTILHTDQNIEGISHRLRKAYLVRLITQLQKEKRDCFIQSNGLIESYKRLGEERRRLLEENRSLRERLERIAELAKEQHE